MHQISVKASFSSAHNLRKYRGKCEKLHGHNWQVEVTLQSQKLNKEGMVMDFNEAKKELIFILDKLDHRYLNEIEPFDKLNPTSENIARYIFETLKSRLKNKNTKVKSVDVWETSNSKASYYEK